MPIYWTLVSLAIFVSSLFYGTKPIMCETAFDQEIIFTVHHDGHVRGIKVDSAEERLLSWSSADQMVKVWDLVTGEELLEFFVPGLIDAKWSNQDTTIVTTDMNEVKIWDIASGKVIETMPDMSSETIHKISSPDGTQLLIYPYEYYLAQVVDVGSGEELFQLQHMDLLWGGAWSPDGEQILTWSMDDSARIWDGDTGELLHHLDHGGGRVEHAQWSHDGKQILSSAPNGVWLWDATTGQNVFHLRLEGEAFYGYWNSDETFILTYANPGGTQIWDSASGEELCRIEFEPQIEWTPSEVFLIGVESDGAVHLWKTPSLPE